MRCFFRYSNIYTKGVQTNQPIMYALTTNTMKKLAPVINFHALTKSVGNRFPVTKRTSRTKPVNNQVILKQQSLSVLLFQQLLLFLCQTNQFGIILNLVLQTPVLLKFLNPRVPCELSQFQEACLSSAFFPWKPLFCFYLRKASPV